MPTDYIACAECGVGLPDCYQCEGCGITGCNCIVLEFRPGMPGHCTCEPDANLCVNCYDHPECRVCAY